MPVLRYWDATTSAWVDIGGSGAPEVYVGNEAPVTRLSEVLWVDPDDNSPGVIGQRWSPEYTLACGSLAQYGQSPSLILTHNLGAKGLIVGHLEDGSWASQINWRCAQADTTTTTVGVYMMNLGPNPAQAVLRFRLLY